MPERKTTAKRVVHKARRERADEPPKEIADDRESGDQWLNRAARIAETVADLAKFAEEK